MSHVCLQCGLAFDQLCHLQQHLPLCSTNTQKFKVSENFVHARSALMMLLQTFGLHSDIEQGAVI